MRPSHAFKPYTPSTSLAVTSSSDRVALPVTAMHVRLRTNVGDAACFVKFGDVTVSAASDGTDMSFGPGAIEVFSVPLNATYVAAKTAAGTATLYVTSGEGA